MFALLSHQDDAMLGEALRSASGGFSEDASEQTAKGEEEDEYDYGNYWGSSSWGHHGVQDAKWLEPKDEWPINPKSEDWVMILVDGVGSKNGPVVLVGGIPTSGLVGTRDGTTTRAGNAKHHGHTTSTKTLSTASMSKEALRRMENSTSHFDF